MTFKSNNPFKSNQLLTQKELINQINAHTRTTKKLVELLIKQVDPMDHYKERNYDNSKKTIQTTAN